MCLSITQRSHIILTDYENRPLPASLLGIHRAGLPEFGPTVELHPGTSLSNGPGLLFHYKEAAPSGELKGPQAPSDCRLEYISRLESGVRLKFIMFPMISLNSPRGIFPKFLRTGFDRAFWFFPCITVNLPLSWPPRIEDKPFRMERKPDSAKAGVRPVSEAVQPPQFTLGLVQFPNKSLTKS